MGSSISVVIGSHTFTSKQDALKYFRKILHSYEINQIVSKTDEEELKLLLARHPDRAEKLALGFSHFKVVRAEFNQRCFHIVRPDGSSIDFSYQYCINYKG